MFVTAWGDRARVGRQVELQPLVAARLMRFRFERRRARRVAGEG